VGTIIGVVQATTNWDCIKYARIRMKIPNGLSSMQKWMMMTGELYYIVFEDEALSFSLKCQCNWCLTSTNIAPSVDSVHDATERNMESHKSKGEVSMVSLSKTDGDRSSRCMDDGKKKGTNFGLSTTDKTSL